MIRLTLTLPQIPAISGSGIATRIRKRFFEEAGKLAVEAVRAHLGTDDIYTLSDTYREQKPKRKGFKRQAGKASDQPLIFSGEMYQGIKAIPDGDLLVIQVEDGKALAKNGEDYAEMWEERTEFLEKGLEDIEDGLDELLAEIISQEMGL